MILLRQRQLAATFANLSKSQPLDMAEPSLVKKVTIASVLSVPIVNTAHSSMLASDPSVAVYIVCSKPITTPSTCGKRENGENRITHITQEIWV